MAPPEAGMFSLPVIRGLPNARKNGPATTRDS
jgi:hypothetical protein